MAPANTPARRARRPIGRRAACLLSLFALTAPVVLASGDARAATQVNLGTAGSYAVLAGSAITNTGPTTISGDVGIHPGTAAAVTGFGSVTHTGQAHYGDGAALQAKADLDTAYTNAANQPASDTIATELGGQLLTGGVYRAASGTFGLTGTLTLDAAGIAGTVWIFQTDTTLVTATDSRVVLVNGAHPCNVFWKVGSSATLGGGTSFAGTILAAQSVTAVTSATIRGRALARSGAVTLDTNTISRSACPAPAPVTEPSPTPTPSPTPSPTPTPTPSPTPAPSPTPSPAPSPTPSPTRPAAQPTATSSPAASPTPTSTRSPAPGQAPTSPTGTPPGPAPDAPTTPAPAAPAPGGTCPGGPCPGLACSRGGAGSPGGPCPG